MSRFSHHLLQLALGALLLHLLWILGYIALDSAVLPAPWAVYKHMPQLDWGTLGQHALQSFTRIAWGIGLASLLAWLMALAMVSLPRLGRSLSTFIYFSYPIPKLALLPVVMLLAGLGEATKVIMILLIILFQLAVSMRDALLQIPAEHYALLRSLGASSLDRLRHILLPAVLPAYLSALRIALGTAISVLFVTETYGTSLGLGYYITEAWMRINYLDMYAGIALLSCFGLLLFILIDFAEHILCPWNQSN